MEHLFFNLREESESDVETIYKALGIEQNIKIGHSTHLLHGVYFSYSIFGVQIKLEYNSYDYDDKYKYMIAIKEDMLSKLEIDEDSINTICKIVMDLLLKNLSIEVAHEVEMGKLEIFHPM